MPRVEVNQVCLHKKNVKQIDKDKQKWVPDSYRGHFHWLILLSIWLLKCRVNSKSQT